MVYLPPLFHETRPEILLAHIERYEFALLVSHGGGLIASQLPFLVERRGERLLLQGHLARGNPQLADLAEGGEALAVFAGPHAYISPTWYGSGPAVPTWNYATVHAYGVSRTISDPDWLKTMLQRLTERHEEREPGPPWRMQELPEDYLDRMVGGVIGVELAVSRLEGKFKLSQNRPAADRPRIIAALERRDDPDSHAVGQLMRERELRG